MKQCASCKESKALHMFNKQASSLDGRQTYCRQCAGAKRKQWTLDHPGHGAAYSKQYALDNPEKSRAMKRAWRLAHPDQERAMRDRGKVTKAAGMKLWREANPEKSRAYCAEYRARKINAIIEPVPSDIWTQMLAFYGSHCMVKGCLNTNLSLDHIIPLNKGGAHSINNFQILCGSHNSSKGDHNTIDYRPEIRME